MKKITLLFALLCAGSSFAMEPQDYKIAILAWGSLVESPGGLLLKEGNGFKEYGRKGPSLPIDYARISQDGRLTLVIAPGLAATNLFTYYVTANTKDLSEAIKSLRDREGSKDPESIGYINLREKTYRRKDFTPATGETEVKKGSINSAYYQGNEMLKRIENWATNKGYNAVIWTDLPPKFTRNQFTLENLKSHLKTLSQDALKKAYCYFKITPEEIRNGTRFGNSLMEYAANRMKNDFGEDVQALSVQNCVNVIRPQENR